MNRITVFAAAAGVAVVLGSGLGWMLSPKEPAPAGLPSTPDQAKVQASVQAGGQAKVEEHGLVTGTIPSRPPLASVASQPQAAPPQPSAPPSFPPPPVIAMLQAGAVPATPRQAAAAAVAAKSRCANPDALGIARTVAIDTAGGPGFGSEQYKAYDFLEPGEVVLTFDDGPWPGNTPAVLAALAAQCVKATFFPIGKHTSWHPEILKLVAAADHTIGSHTWSHANLAKKSFADAKDEIENGFSAVAVSVGRPLAPFFRFPGLSQTPELTAYLAQRNIGIFSADLDSFDFKLKNPDKVITSVMSKLQKRGKGIVLMHDFQHSTAVALPTLLAQLKAKGFKIVHMRPKDPVTTLPDYDAAMAKAQAGQTVDARPTAAVVRTIEDGQ